MSDLNDVRVAALALHDVLMGLAEADYSELYQRHTERHGQSVSILGPVTDLVELIDRPRHLATIRPAVSLRKV